MHVVVPSTISEVSVLLIFLADLNVVFSLTCFAIRIIRSLHSKCLVLLSIIPLYGESG